MTPQYLSNTANTHLMPLQYPSMPIGPGPWAQAHASGIDMGIGVILSGAYWEVINWGVLGGYWWDSGEVLGGISPIKKAKEPPIDEHLKCILAPRKVHFE